MKSTILLTVMVLTFAAQAQEKGLNDLSPILKDGELSGDERMIEPTSPVLGKKLTEMIRHDERDPEAILNDIYTNYPHVEKDLQLSSMAYFRTMIEPLKKYCVSEHKDEVVIEKEVRVVEQGAIPLTILEPLHGEYRKNMSSLTEEFNGCSEEDAKKEAKRVAKEYQAQRYDCNVVKQIDDMALKMNKFMFTGKLKRLLAKHQEISSAEAAFPRIQFTINGFTQYVYNEIMKMPYDRLADLLKLTYQAQKEWLAAKDRGEDAGRYLSAIEKKALAAGYLPREILLIMAYSNRNMPSLDVQYGQDTHKALMLEAYFWKSRKHRDIAQKKYEKDIYPNKVMKRNPGVYHYATSALMACDVRLSGFSGVMARVVSLGNKMAYKVHKLLGAVKGKDGKKGGLKGVMAEAKQQAFGPAIDAGRYGGSYGLKLCRKYTPKDKWLKNQAKDVKSDAVDEALEGEDLSAEEEAALDK